MFSNRITEFFGNWLARYLTQTVKSYHPFSVHRHDVLATVMQPGDVLLVEGDHRISTAIKYLTQSTCHMPHFIWGHRLIRLIHLPSKIRVQVANY